MCKLNFQLSDCQEIIKRILKGRINHVIYLDGLWNKEGGMIEGLVPQYLLSSDVYGSNPILFKINIIREGERISYSLSNCDPSLEEILGEEMSQGRSVSMKMIPYVDSIYKGSMIMEKIHK